MPWKNRAAISGTPGPKVLAELGTNVLKAAMDRGDTELAVQVLERIARITGGWTEERLTPTWASSEVTDHDEDQTK